LSSIGGRDASGQVARAIRTEMAKAEQIKALIRCHAEGDDTRF
jgi:cell division ATPase FtsA